MPFRPSEGRRRGRRRFGEAIPCRSLRRGRKGAWEAARPVVGSLSGVIQSAGEAEASLKNAGQWFAWKWVAVAAGGLVGVCLVAYASLAWQLHQVSSLREEKAALQADVAQMQASVAALGARAGASS